MNTPDTTRLPFEDPEKLSIAVCQMVYPSSTVPWRANSVILIYGDDFRTIAPAVSFVHFPTDAPILVSNTPYLTGQLLNEIARVNPAGNNVPHVILVGNFENQVKQQLHQNGLSTLHFHHPDPFVQSLHIAEWRKRLLPDMMPEMITKNTFLVSVEQIDEALPAFGFAAHMGTPFLYTHKDALPEPTRRFLASELQRNVTVIGSEKTISVKVEEELKTIVKGHVERFGGSSIPDIAVDFSRRKSDATGIGWGRNEPMKGDAFTFFPIWWKYAMIAAPLSHMGKHTPLLPIPDGQLPMEYEQYLTYLRPMKMHPEPPFMHAFILGHYNQIPLSTQIKIEEDIMLKEMM